MYLGTLCESTVMEGGGSSLVQKTHSLVVAYAMEDLTAKGSKMEVHSLNGSCIYSPFL